MDALVTQVAIASIPEPVPPVVKTVFIEGTVRRGPEEFVPVHPFRDLAILHAPDAGTRLKAEPFGHVDLADAAAVEEGHGLADNSPQYQKNFARIAEHSSKLLAFGCQCVGDVGLSDRTWRERGVLARGVRCGCDLHGGAV